ncbi:MAG: substrate-binding domain-containing protein [Rhodobacteraceae bacterium]|jgi:ribose transport system substrate-binding protein|nr:substrate-binding domain-containing protein [Paracoccaceae bacterium]
MTRHKDPQGPSRHAPSLCRLAGTLTIAAAAAFGSAPAQAEDGLSVALFTGTCANPIRTTWQAQAEYEIQQKYADVVSSVEWFCAQGDVNLGISQIKSIAARGFDAAVIESDWGGALLPAIKDAARAGVKISIFLIPVDGEVGKDYVNVVLSDFDKLGENAAEFFIDKLGGKGTIIGLGGPPNNTWDTPQIEAMKRVFAERAPDITYLDTGWADWNPASSAQAMGTLLSKYPEIDGVWSMEATTLIPVLNQFIAHDREPPAFYGFDTNGLAGQYLDLKKKYPSLEYGMAVSPSLYAREAVGFAIDAALGKEVPAEFVIDEKFFDCSAVCSDLHEPSMPDSYIPTSDLPLDFMQQYLK